MPFKFILDYLVPLEVTIRPMFGMFAIYTGKKMVLILRERKVNSEVNGVWIATTKANHKSLRHDFPSLRSITNEFSGVTETEWQLIPADADDFEIFTRKVCELIKQGDLRIGRIPLPGKFSKKKP